MTKELMTTFYELSSRDPYTLTSAELKTLLELKEQVHAELKYWTATDVDVFRAKIEEWGKWKMEVQENNCLVKAGELMLAGWTPGDEPWGPYCVSWGWHHPDSEGIFTTEKAHRRMLEDAAFWA
jgi:hypothetical protein